MQQRTIIQQDDGFPLPPPPPHPQIISGSNNQQNQLNSTAADWTPQQYLEKGENNLISIQIHFVNFSNLSL
jgi:hypothetical protein